MPNVKEKKFTKQVFVAMTPKQHKEFKALAETLGLSMSTMGRIAITQYMEQKQMMDTITDGTFMKSIARMIEQKKE